MSDFDFLKEFGKDLDQERLEFEHTEADWNAVNRQLDDLDAQKKRRRLLGGWFLPFLVIAGFLCLSLMLWFARQEIMTLKTEIGQIHYSLEHKNTVFQPDTTIQHVQVMHYDTVYETVVVRKTKVVYVNENRMVNAAYLPSMPSQASQSISSKQGFENVETKVQTGLQIHKAIEQSDKIVNETSNFIAFEQLDRKQKSIAENSTIERSRDVTDGYVLVENGAMLIENEGKSDKRLAFLPALPLKAVLSLHHRHKPDFNAFTMVAEKETKKEAILRLLKPHNVEVGIRTTSVIPISKQVALERSFTYGATAGVTVGNNLHVIAGIDNGYLDYVVKSTDLIGSGVPNITPPTPDDVLDYVEVQQPITDFSVGLRYNFRRSRRWQPNVLLTWVGERIHKQTFTYEFENLVTGEDSYVKVPQQNAYFNATGVQAGLGFNWFFVKKMSLGLDALYQQQISSVVPLLHERLGARAGLKYYF